MYLLHRKKNGIYTNISVCLSYFEITVATLSSPFPDQMVDQHPEITSTALNVSRDQDTLMSPRDRSPLKTLSPRRPSGQVLRNQMSPLHNLTLLQLEFNCLFVWQEENCPPDWVFLSILSPMEFWFLAALASGLIGWEHLISSDIVDLIAQILFKLNWTVLGWCHHWIQ